MPMKLLWIGLPQRRTAKRLHVSAYVSPRLTFSGSQTNGPLSEFPVIMEWPQVVNSLDFAVEFVGGPTVKTRRQLVDPALWDMLFRPDTLVNSWTLPDHSQTIVHGFPVPNILHYVEDLYAGLAEQSPTDHPPISTLISSLGPLRAASNMAEFGEMIDGELRSKIPNTQQTRRALWPGYPLTSSPVESDFIQAHRFYRRPDQRQPYLDATDPAAVPDPPQAPQLGFNQIISLLGDSPQILRRLGLIIDLELDYDETAIPAAGELRIVPSDITPGVDLRPRTKYVVGSDRFLTAPRATSLVDDGTLLLDLEKELFEVYQVDIDGASLKLIDFYGNLGRMTALPEQTSQTPDQSSVPSLRSAGFTVSVHGRAVQLIDALDDQTALNADIENDNVTLGIEDVMRGYRLDVFDRGRWRSLHQRVGDHVVLDAPGGNPIREITGDRDEGFVKATAATSTRVDVTDPNDPNQAPSEDLYLHEALFGWDGWSLAAPRPGKVIGEPDPGTGANTLDQEQEQAHPELPLISTYRPADGTLPRLRYGAGYRLRARAVDLAGNGLEPSGGDWNQHVTPEHVYTRYEPITQPAVIRRHPDTEGESVEHLVIRSNFDKTDPAQYVAQQYVQDAIAGEAHTYAADSQRHIAPPKGSVQMAELDGRLDAAFGAGGDPATVFKMALREEGTFLDTHVVDIATGQKTIDVTADIQTVPPNSPLPDADHRGDGIGQGVYMYRPGPDLQLPYLPDPMAVGAAFYGLPGHETSVVEVPFAGAWPTLDPFRLRLVGGPAGVSPSSTEVTVSLPQAERRIVRLSSLPSKEALGKMALWRALSDPAQAALESDVVSGRHWMLTPFRYVELVHAVQQPLAEPQIDFTPDRAVGETSTGFEGTIGNDAKSTGRLDVMAMWSEPIDRVSDPNADPTSDRVSGAAVAFGWDIRRGEDDAELNLSNRQSRHEFGDTKHRKVTYQAVATTRFREYFPRAITDDPAMIQRLGPEVELSIPSSARPAAPKVLYMVPTFKWVEQKLPGGQRNRRSRRIGGGIRVYLDRPWWSSGDGEQLGVVLPPTPRRVLPTLVDRGDFVAVAIRSRTGGIGRVGGIGGGVSIDPTAGLDRIWAIPSAGALADPYVTKAGQDPTWATGDPTMTLRISDFPLATPESGSGYAIAERDGARVAVAGHDVGWDAERKLWYCDIEIDAGDSYFPFVRLALCRFQPESVTGVHLSPIVIGEFMQLAADRTATFVMQSGSARITVSGLGPRNIVAERVFPSVFGRPSSDLSLSRRVTATLQRQVYDESDAEWEDVGDETTLSLRRGRGTGRTWQGDVAIPQGSRNKRHRILIREYEYFFTDWDPTEHPNASVVIPGTPVGFTRSRIVYAEAFRL